jgi:hypothetical protein
MSDLDAQAREALLRRERVLSAVINAAISIGFFLLVFRWSPATRMALAIDCLPQTLGVTLLGGLVPSMITLFKVRNGAVVPAGPTPSRGAQALRVLGCAILAVPVLGGAGALLFALLAPPVTPPLPALVAKTLYGAALGAITTPPILRMALGMPLWRSRSRVRAAPGPRVT